MIWVSFCALFSLLKTFFADMNDELLIMLVEQCPHIYNKADKNCKEDRINENSWVSIAGHLQSNPEQAKKRWNNLRDRFVRAYREFTEITPSGFAGVTKNKPNFPYYEMMTWLISFIRKRKVTSSVKNIEGNAEDIQNSGLLQIVGSHEREIFLNTQRSEIEEEDASSQTSQYSEILSPSEDNLSKPGISKAYKEPSTQLSSPKLSKASLQESMSKALQSFNKLCEQRNNQTGVSSSDKNFMMSIVEDMQLLPMSKKVRFKREVLDLLIKYCED